MPKKATQYLFIDFDSTFIKIEGLDELAAIALANNKNKEQILKKIKTLTEQAMEGTMPFGKSLNERIKFLPATRSHITTTVTKLKKNISTSILRNKAFFKTYRDHIYIISYGFKELILPVVKSFDLTEEHIFANNFLFDENGVITGVDKKNPLSQNDGKIKLLKTLNLKGEITVLGDGYTDYKLKKAGLAKTFVAFTENIRREHVAQKADYIADSFDTFKTHFLPRLVQNRKN